jgi:EGF-like domain
MHNKKASIVFLVAFVVVAVQACSTTTDCSLNGVCTNGLCVCEPAWMGVDCGTLNLLPTPKNVCFIIFYFYVFIKDICFLKLYLKAGFNVNQSSSWGGGVIQDSEVYTFTLLFFSILHP